MLGLWAGVMLDVKGDAPGTFASTPLQGLPELVRPELDNQFSCVNIKLGYFGILGTGKPIGILPNRIAEK